MPGGAMVGAPSVPVQKRWVEGEGRRFLVESVDYQTLKTMLDRLPARQSSIKPAGRSANPQSLPAVTPVESSRKTMLAQVSQPQGTNRMGLASVTTTPGVVLDYDLVYSPLLNVQLGGGVSQKWGSAAVYIDEQNDFWNWYSNPWSMSAAMGLQWSSQVDSYMTMTVDNAPGQWGNITGDAMFDGYIYNDLGIPITIALNGVPAGSYDLYIYGHGAADNQNGVYQVYADGNDYGTQATSEGGCWNQFIGTAWQEGTHYVRYGNLVVGSGGNIMIIVCLGTYSSSPIIPTMAEMKAGLAVAMSANVKRARDMPTWDRFNTGSTWEPIQEDGPLGICSFTKCNPTKRCSLASGFIAWLVEPPASSPTKLD
jgi:hypothetical protein